MLASVFIGTSLDGFIARHNGEYDFLPAGGGEPHGYDEFMAGIDTLVIGRKTFETVLALAEWPYAGKRVVVLSSRALDLSRVRMGGRDPSTALGAGSPTAGGTPALRSRAVPEPRVEQMSGEPAEIIAKLEASGAKSLYVDGGDTIQRFLRAGLIQRLIMTRVPVLIGEGIALFGALPRDVKLEHVATTSYRSGLVQSEYRVIS